MRLPNKPLRILGIPWRVEVVERIDGNPDVCYQSNVESATFKLASHCHPGRRGWHVFWGILHAIQQHEGFGDAESKPGEFDAAHTALYAAIADNWPVVRRWFGYTGKPQVVVRTDALTDEERQTITEFGVAPGRFYPVSSPDAVRTIAVQGDPVVEPCTLRIAGMTWAFERPQWIPGRDAGSLGLSQAENLALHVRTDGISAHRAAEVALHELAHASVQVVCRLGDVEEWVAGVSGSLAQVFFDNPDWMEAIFGEEGESNG